MTKWILLFLLNIVCAVSWGQNEPISTEASKDSIRYTHLKKRLEKNRISRELHKLLFRDIYNRKPSTVEEIKVIKNAFEEYRGYRIRNITIKQLDVLGASVHDTTRVPQKFNKFISRNVHINTRQKALRRALLLFKEGDWIDPVLMIDNERIIRKSGEFVDVRILPIPLNEPNYFIDVLILIQDSWPVVPEGGFSGFSDFSVGISNNNVLGQLHKNRTVVHWDKKDTVQNFGFRTVYTVPYINKSLISGEIGIIWERDLKHQYIRASRSFLALDTKYAGAVELGVKNVREYRKEPFTKDFSFIFQVKTVYQDAWLGRSFPLKSKADKPHRRFVAAARHYSFSHIDRPLVSSDSNRIYWNQTNLLISLAFSNRSYKRDFLIYGFGRTEDVPVGNMASLTLGQGFTEFGNRWYLGSRFSKGTYISDKGGYLYGLLDIGSFIKNKEVQQGTLGFTINYFSPLINVGLRKLRQFVNFRYTEGLNRDELEYINLTGRFGMRGINSDILIGKKRINFGSETVLFSHSSVLGFRAASFVFVDLGLISDQRSIWSSKLYQAYGLGIRLRNEHLTFNTIELRLAYYPNIPLNSNAIRFGASGATPFRLNDFDIEAPRIVPFD
jgi:ribonucleotide reductase alpha subunit